MPEDHRVFQLETRGQQQRTRRSSAIIHVPNTSSTCVYHVNPDLIEMQSNGAPYFTYMFNVPSLSLSYIHIKGRFTASPNFIHDTLFGRVSKS